MAGTIAAAGTTGMEAAIAGGMVWGMASGAANGAGMTALAGGSGSDIFAGATMGAWAGGMGGALSGAVGGMLGDFTGVEGCGFKNAMYEIGHSTVKGGATGLVAGAPMALIEQDASYLWKGAAFGAASGGGYSLFKIAQYGPLYDVTSTEWGKGVENFGQVVRRGGLAMNAKDVYAQTWYKTIVVDHTSLNAMDVEAANAIFTHETYHVKQWTDRGYFGGKKYFKDHSKKYPEGSYKKSYGVYTS